MFAARLRYVLIREISACFEINQSVWTIRSAGRRKGSCYLLIETCELIVARGLRFFFFAVKQFLALSMQWLPRISVEFPADPKNRTVRTTGSPLETIRYLHASTIAAIVDELTSITVTVAALDVKALSKRYKVYSRWPLFSLISMSLPQRALYHNKTFLSEMIDSHVLIARTADGLFRPAGYL